MTMMKRVMLLSIALVLMVAVVGIQNNPTNAQTDEPCFNEYVIRDGDTLSEIAKAFNVDQAELAAANGIENPRVIYIGDVLCLDGLVVAQPAAGGSPTTPAPGTTTPEPGTTPPPTVPAPPVVPPSLDVQRDASIMIRDVAYTTDANGIYIVRGFDRLYNLSAVFGVDMAELAAVNNITDRSVIFAGQQLIIPMPTYSGPVPGDGAAVSLVPRVAGPGDTVTVRGANFAPNTEVAIYAEKFSSGLQSDALETVTTDAQGRFEVAVEIPATWSNGTALTDRTISLVARVTARPTVAFGSNFYLNLVWLDANNR